MRQKIKRLRFGFPNTLHILFLRLLYNHCGNKTLWWEDQRKQSDTLKEDTDHNLTIVFISEISPNYQKGVSHFMETWAQEAINPVRKRLDAETDKARMFLIEQRKQEKKKTFLPSSGHSSLWYRYYCSRKICILLCIICILQYNSYRL